MLNRRTLSLLLAVFLVFVGWACNARGRDTRAERVSLDVPMTTSEVTAVRFVAKRSGMHVLRVDCPLIARDHEFGAFMEDMSQVMANKVLPPQFDFAWKLYGRGTLVSEGISRDQGILGVVDTGTEIGVKAHRRGFVFGRVFLTVGTRYELQVVLGKEFTTLLKAEPALVVALN